MTVAAWAADCAEQVLPLFEADVPGDERVRDAIALAREFASGALGAKEAIRVRGGQAGAAARDAATAAATAAAYAAEQAAAVAHMGAHALGAAGYAGKARVFAAPTDEDLGAVIAVLAREQVSMMTDAVAAALTRLPSLGADGAGPLGPGRLSSGHVGQTIRAVQAGLAAR